MIMSDERRRKIVVIDESIREMMVKDEWRCKAFHMREREREITGSK